MSTVPEQTPSSPKKWTLEETLSLFKMPFGDLIARAHKVLEENFDPNAMQVGTLVNIKVGGCPESCKYCAQSAHWDTDVDKQPVMLVKEVSEATKKAKEAGASRMCVGASWRSPRDEDIDMIIDMIKVIQAEDMESCMTLGMLTEAQAQRLKEAGLDYYNHNIDTSKEYYPNMVTTRTFEDRLETLEHVRKSGINTCTGGILGLGEAVDDRASMLITLANLPEQPKSVTINQLIRVEGTPYADNAPLDPIDLVRTIAVARIMMPHAFVRLTAGRSEMSKELQALSFFAGANSLFFGEKLLTRDNPIPKEDKAMLDQLGIRIMKVDEFRESA